MKKKNKQPVKTKAKVSKSETQAEPQDAVGSESEAGAEESKTLSDAEREELNGLEDSIRGAQNQFFTAGRALHTILDKRLYKELSDFDTYCDQKWGFSGSHARRLIGAYKSIKVLRAASPAIDEALHPKNEFQARILVSSGAEGDWIKNWKKVIKAAGDDATKITGTLVQNTLGPSDQTSASKRQPISATAKNILELISTAKKLDNLEEVVKILIKIEKKLKDYA